MTAFCVVGGTVWELLHAASIGAMTTITAMPTLRTVIILSPDHHLRGLGHWRSAIPVDVDHPKLEPSPV